MFKVLALLLTLGFSTYSVAMGVIVHIDDFSIVMEVFNVGVTILLSGAKTTFWLVNGEKIKLIMYRLESSVFHCEEVDDFKPEFTVNQAKNSGVNYAFLLLLFSHLVLGLGYIPAICIALWYRINDLPITNVKTFETLPYYIHIPFEHDTALKYVLACLSQCIPMYLYVNAFIGVDSLFMNLMNFIATHMFILQGAFRTMRKRCVRKIRGNDLAPDGLHNSDELEGFMMEEMKKCIQHLQILLRSCKDIEDTFKFLSLVQALGTIYILCTTLLLLSTTPVLTKEFGKNIFYLVGVIVQLGLYCWFGNQLTLQAANLPLALWESDWLETRKPFKICMLLTMMRLRRPLLINADIERCKGRIMSIDNGSNSTLSKNVDVTIWRCNLSRCSNTLPNNSTSLFSIFVT
ncbi:hypothetical protein Trydic_g13064 [Trypoxylus dichotomus]